MHRDILVFPCIYRMAYLYMYIWIYIGWSRDRFYRVPPVPLPPTPYPLIPLSLNPSTPSSHIGWSRDRFYLWSSEYLQSMWHSGDPTLTPLIFRYSASWSIYSILIIPFLGLGYIYTCIYIYIYTFICIYVYMQVQKYIHSHKYKYIYALLCLYILLFVYFFALLMLFYLGRILRVRNRFL
jgi:hypothetical protein